MSKQFVVDRHTTPGTPALDPVGIPKVPVYESVADATVDLSNLEEGQIIATKDTGVTEKVVDAVRAGDMHAVTSNAVSEALSYSTEEQLTGARWIDGKPIYRKVFSGTTVPASNVIGAITGYEDVVSISGTSHDPNNNYWLMLGYAGQTRAFIFPNSDVYLTGGTYAVDKYRVIVEYTKTTD